MADKIEKPKAEDGVEKTAKSGGVVGTVVTAAALGAASFGTVYMLPTPEPVVIQDIEKTKEAEAPIMKISDLSFTEMAPMTISLEDHTRLLKIGITLETVSDAEVSPTDPYLRDAFVGYLRALQFEQIQDAAYMAQMRSQLLRRAKLVKGHDKVHGILITEFLVR